MFGLLARVLEIMYSVWPSYAGSIVLLTLVVMLVLAPLTLRGTKSMLAMQVLQPEIRKMQNRYKDDRAKLNEETMKFYQEHKINPLSGCLPLLIQLPVFFILYEVLLGLTKRAPYGRDLGAAMGCHLQNGVGCANNVFSNAGYFHPKYLGSSSKLSESLSGTRQMLSAGLDLSESPLKALGSGGIAHAVPYIIMVLVVVALTYIQQMQIQSRTPKNAPVNPTQQLTMKLMPVIMGVVYLLIPAGVVVYFLVSSVFRIGQQTVVTRSFASSGLAERVALASEGDDDVEPPPKMRMRDMLRPQETSQGPIVKGKAPSNARSSASGKSKSAGTKSAGTKSTSSRTTPKPAAKGGSSGLGSGRKAGSAAASKASRAKVTETTATEVTAKEAKTSAPSRKPAAAPTRRAPGRPGGGNKKK